MHSNTKFYEQHFGIDIKNLETMTKKHPELKGFTFQYQTHYPEDGFQTDSDVVSREIPFDIWRLRDWQKSRMPLS